jgi:hypothetical protein
MKINAPMLTNPYLMLLAGVFYAAIDVELCAHRADA